MEPTIEIIEMLARQAGEILLDGYGRPHDIDYKGSINLVTETDHRSEEFLIKEIEKRFPHHSIIAEESGLKNGAPEGSGQWHIDPLDGTVNFAHGIPCFSVSLAYAENEEIRLGVVYDPLRDECFTAERGGGAWLNEDRIQVSQTRELIECLLTTGFPYEKEDGLDRNLELYTRFSHLTQGVRRLGSAALDLCYVAAGRFDGYWELDVKTWDCAAGALLVQEAGGRITSADGNPRFFKSPISIVAANPGIHNLMMPIIQEL
ncbi:MAG: inositol monophosphatase family protein [Anaerolineaceae bacterium]